RYASAARRIPQWLRTAFRFLPISDRLSVWHGLGGGSTRGSERPRQRGELAHAQCFRPRGGIDPGLTDAVLGVWRERAQALPQHFAALAEGSLCDALQIGEPCGRDR